MDIAGASNAHFRLQFFQPAICGFWQFKITNLCVRNRNFGTSDHPSGLPAPIDFLKVTPVKCLRMLRAVELHANLISRRSCSDNSANLLGLPRHAFQADCAQSTSRTHAEMYFLGFRCIILVRFMLASAYAFHPSISAGALAAISDRRNANARFTERSRVETRHSTWMIYSASAVLPVITPADNRRNKSKSLRPAVHWRSRQRCPRPGGVRRIEMHFGLARCWISTASCFGMRDDSKPARAFHLLKKLQPAVLYLGKR